jgi:hypothetical protein
MAFTRLENITKESIEDWELRFLNPGPSNTEDSVSGNLEVQVVLSNGEIETVNINVLLRLNDDAEGQGYLTNLNDMKDYITARLNSELLPL